MSSLIAVDYGHRAESDDGEGDVTRRSNTRRADRLFLGLHVGGVHLVVERPSYRMLAALAGLASALGGEVWFTGR